MADFAPDGNPERISHRPVRKTALWITAALVLLMATASTVLLQRPSPTHMYVVVQASESLTIEFLQQESRSADHCRVLTNRVAEAMLAHCASCRLLVSRCLSKLDARQSSFLSGQPVETPIMRTPTGAVAFISDKPELAREACRESERQAAGKLQVRCVAAGVASSVAGSVGSGTATSTLIVSSALGLILFAIAMSVVGFYRTPRAGSLAIRSSLDVATEVPARGDLRAWKSALLVKRFLDVFLALVLLIVLSPILLLVSFLILVLEGRPVFYVSRRHISASDTVPILKFRTMEKDATSPKFRLYERFMRDGFLDIPLSCEVYTPIGRFLERTQLVETPQLLNVVLHDMSFVGNRPLPASNVAQLKASFPGWAERFDSPAGITGIAQVVGRRNLTPSERIELESLYSRVYQHGEILKCDLKIITITAWVVLFAEGITVSQARELLRSCLR